MAAARDGDTEKPRTTPIPARPLQFPAPVNAYERRAVIDHLRDEQLPAWGSGKPALSEFGAWLSRIPQQDLRDLVDVVRGMMCEEICPDEANGTRERTFHSDIPNLTTERLLEERDRVRLRALIEPKPSHWLRDRAKRINQELVTRRGRPSPGGDAHGRT